MKRKIFSDLSSKEIIKLKKSFLGIIRLPKLLKFEIFQNQVYWKNTLLVEEHCLLDYRLFFLFDKANIQNLKDGIYWTDGYSIKNINISLKNQFDIENIKFSEIKLLEDKNIVLIFENEEFWHYKQNKNSSNILTNYVLEESKFKTASFINMYNPNFYNSNEETLLMSIFEFVKMDNIEFIQPNFEPFEFYSKQKVPLFMEQIFRENWAYRSLILGIYQKLLTNPSDENLILLGILNIEIKKIKNGK